MVPVNNIAAIDVFYSAAAAPEQLMNKLAGEGATIIELFKTEKKLTVQPANQKADKNIRVYLKEAKRNNKVLMFQAHQRPTNFKI